MVTARERAPEGCESWTSAWPSPSAGSLHNRSGAMAALGRREDALTAIEEAVQIRRDLAAKVCGAPHTHPVAKRSQFGIRSIEPCPDQPVHRDSSR
jgi:hypothetical protein